MELFYSKDIRGSQVLFDKDESVHMVRVLRHREGDVVNVIDGCGTLMECRLEDANPAGATAVVVCETPGWGSRPYRLTMAVSPTKNNERYEWFAEKATEVGVDRIVPVLTERSERRVFKTERIRKILVSAAKQSLKAAVPEISEALGIREFISAVPSSALKLIAYCFEGTERRISIRQALEESDASEIVVLIGPEGDFSPQEASDALAAGFIPVHLGPSRLRTETAALTAVETVYSKYCL
ncbi:MAG: 16S rRNA (uracil(1498)-N(3))-methyltransferase [Bacteroidales bacterium]|nr:16S rRNA (uracil(1498)-N(3))-methyltransferase [Bacteroidales bacterium]